MRGKKILAVSVVLLFFFGINFATWFLITRRCSGNFSGATRLHMIDVSSYLPFEEGSSLAKVDTDLKLEGDLPVLDGAAALVPVYASVIDNIYPEGCVTYEGGTFSDDNEYGENFAEGSAMRYRNTIRGFNAVVDGDADLFFTAYPSEEQLAYAKEQGVELEIVPVGLEAFVFFVNKDNPVTGLTCDEIRDIYSGEITNWSEVGGPDRIIDPLTRIAGSGSQTMMEKFMGDKEIAPRDPMTIFGGAIGYSFRYYLSGMVANDNVRMLDVDGVSPSEENIRNGSYPLTASFYVVYRKDNTNPNVELIVDFLLSEEGSDLISQCGYTPLS
ncbi:MAG TPA: phosphate ABC transporter substrate-binding protein, PhoT family [Clostridiales bacterium]|nr:phosphate ABC transporter substrate-binding protein, PhoT family [Clostridiales bacterium]